MAKTADYYRRLPYTRRLRLETDERGTYYVAFVSELPGVEASGDTDVDARAALAAAFEDYLAAMLEWGEHIPEPTPWPESVGLPAGASFESAPVSLVAFAPVEIGNPLPAFDARALAELKKVEQLGREMETAAI